MKGMFKSFRKKRGGDSVSSTSAAAVPETSPPVIDDAVADETTPMLYKQKTKHLFDDDQVVNEDFVDDGTFDETYSRKVARFLSKYSLYNPAVGADLIPARGGKVDEEGSETQKFITPPSLEKAWDYFEYQCLPRRFTYIEDQGEGRKYVLASQGEEDPTKLYPVIDTPIGDMADFGMGVGLYFQTVRFFGIVCFIAGCISIPMMRYYASDTYSPGSDGGEGWEAYTNSFSAVCADQKFKPCPDCPKEGDPNFIEGRMIEEDDLMYILTNRCEMSNVFGYYASAALIFVLLSSYVFIYMQRRYRIELDESEQTTTDYAIRIMNPPTSPTAKDPEVWKAFFEEKFENVQVSACTIAVNNEELVEALLKKYNHRVTIKEKLPLDVIYDEDDLDGMAELLPKPFKLTRTQNTVLALIFYVVLFILVDVDHHHSALYTILGLLALNFFLGGGKSGQEMVDEMRELDEEIRHLASEGEEFEVTDVFMTFETEEMQRLVLTSMCIPGYRKSEVNDELKFEGIVLEVKEPDEPSSLRWEDLDVPYVEEFWAKCRSFFLAFVFTVAGGFAIVYVKTHSVIGSTITIILLNVLSPIIADKLTESESNDTETDFATSAYIKVTLIRWIYTVFVNFAVTPFTSIIRPDELIEEVRLLYTAETLQRPILQMIGIGGHIARHFRGPRAKDQRSMNLAFMPSGYSIGEKYTEITKLLFFTFFYAIIFPMGFFYASLCFLVYYWADKFGILRQWNQGPKINAEISLYSTYYLLVTVFLYALASAYTVAEFPFDMACQSDAELPEEYIGRSVEVEVDEKEYYFTVGSNEEVYEYCDQNVIRSLGLASFPPIPSRLDDPSSWMSDAQITIATIFGYSLGVITVVIFFSIFYSLYSENIQPLFDEKWTPDSVANDMRFGDVPEIYGYIPSIVKAGLQYPLLLCDISSIDHELLSWSCVFEDYSLLYDVPEELREKSFSVVKSWNVDEILPPPAAKYSNAPAEISLGKFFSYYLNYFFGGE